MTRINRRLCFVVLTTLLGLSAVSPIGAVEPIVIKFSHVVTNDAPKGKAALKFKELVEQRTGGKVRIEVYANSTLYRDKDEMAALQLGAVHILAPSLAKFGLLGVSEFEVFDLPYLFDDYADLHKITNGPIGQKLLRKLEPKGIIGLAFWDNGFKVMSGNRPLKNPADFRGLRMRIQPSKVLDAQMRALGALPQLIDFSDVYRALKTGVVDGTENPPSNLYSQKMYEIQRYVTASNHGYLGYAVIVNKRFWDALPSNIRETLETTMQDVTRYANEMAKRENDDALQAVRRTGKSQVYALTAEERQAWKKVLIGVHREQEDRIGKETIKAIYAATGFDPSKL
jgi:C4-dicarboxylate-binding protein DctP